MALSDEQFQALAVLRIDPNISNIELGKRVGVTPRTIYNWQRNAEFLSVLEGTDLDHLEKVYLAKAASGEVAALKVFMEYWGQQAGGLDSFAEALELSDDHMERICRDAYEYYRTAHSA